MSALLLPVYKNHHSNTIYICGRGRTGNNIFQYMAGEVIKYIYGYNEIKFIKYQPPCVCTIDDNLYKKIVSGYLQNNIIELPIGDIYMFGFFQYSNILFHLRNHIKSLFNIDNMTKVNDEFTISAIMSHKSIHKPVADTDLVIHFRLDDFIVQDNRCQIFDKVEISKIIDRCEFTKLYIVCDKLRQDWEIKYVQYFIDKYNAIVLSGSLLDDFVFLKDCKKLFTSPSTYCWLAAYLGNADQIHIPYNVFLGDNQDLGQCSLNCTIYRNIPFTTATNLLT
jgi:hypothetical protein